MELVVGFSVLGEIMIEDINIVSRIDDNEDFGIIFFVVMVMVDVVVETAVLVVCDELITVIVEDGTTRNDNNIYTNVTRLEPIERRSVKVNHVHHNLKKMFITLVWILE